MSDREVTPQLWNDIHELRSQLLGAGLVLSEKMPDCPQLEFTGWIVREVTEENARVRGNRSMEVKPSWEDAKYILAATLRKTLEMLEEEQKE